VRNYDEDMPANTIRAWTIGLILCTVGSAINMLFSLRNPSVSVTTYVIQLVAYPIGLLWDLVMPDHQFSVFGLKFNLKPGKFNMKEHTIIVVMSNVSARPTPRSCILPTICANPSHRLLTEAVCSTQLMSSWLVSLQSPPGSSKNDLLTPGQRLSSTTRTSAGDSRFSLVSRLSAPDTDWLVSRDVSS
jgi:hypothetical protein